MRNQVVIIVNVFILLSLSARSQQNNNWYFGKGAAITFNNVVGKPTPSALPKVNMTTNEGSASVSDANGQLLFYTNGVTVFNREHSIMLNGDGLLGHISACQSSLIIPVPGNDSLFYIFVTDAIENGFANGYRYSVVNMRRDNGRGEVITKNSLLTASCTERLTAARHRNGTDIWVITNDKNSNIFRAWRVGCAGLQPVPVVSTVGLVMDQHIHSNTGQMKISPDGTQLCQTHFFDSEAVPGAQHFFQLFDFDNSTGQLSNAKYISLPNTQITGCEFSPDSRLLYLTRPSQRAISQVECKLPTASDIVASAVTIATSTRSYYGIQLAPDEKIYLSSELSRFLAAINKPNSKGIDCDFQTEQVELSDYAAMLGLPAYTNHIAYDPDNGFDYNITDSCTGTVEFNAFTTVPGPVSWSWDFGDGNTSTDQNPVHTFIPSNESYSVKVTIVSSIGCGTIERSRIITPNDKVMELDFDIVNRCDSGYVRFINNNLPVHPGDQFVWDFGDGNTSTAIEPIHTYGSDGSFIIKLTLTGTNSCRNGSSSDTVNFSPFTLNVSPDQQIMIGQQVQLNATASTTVNYQWTPSTGLNASSVASPIATPQKDIVYKVAATNERGCTVEDSVRITVIDLPDIYVPSGFTPNNDQLNDNIKPFFGSKISLNEFSIFNRWGAKIFSTTQRGKGWNGKLNGIDQATGTYVWLFKGKDENGKIVEKKGTFTLIR